MSSGLQIGRSIFASLLGLAITVAVLVYGPALLNRRPPSLADHLSRTETLLYIRTTKAETIENVSALYGISVPTLAEATLYEAAIIRSGDSPLWVTQSDAVPEDPLSSDLFFRKAPHPGRDRDGPEHSQDFLWIDGAGLRLPSNDIGSLARAALFGAKAVLSIHDAPGRGRLLLLGATFPRSIAASAPVLSGASVVSLSVREPRTVGSAFLQSLEAVDPNLAEGVEGIFNERLARIGGFDRLRPLFQKPAAVLFGEEHFVLAGDALAKDIAEWSSGLEKDRATGKIRTLELGENSRTDISAETENSEQRTVSGWQMRGVGPLLFFASRNGEFAMSNDENALSNALSGIGRSQSALWLRVDLPSLLIAAKKIQGLETELRDFLSLLTLQDAVIEASMNQVGSDIVLEWKKL